MYVMKLAGRNSFRSFGFLQPRPAPKHQTLALLLLVSYAYVWHAPDPNEQSRLNLVYAIVFYGKLNVDEFKDNTIDIARYQGHYYCDKAPGLSFLAAPAMWALKPVWLRVAPTRPMRMLLTVYAPRVFAVSLPSAAFAALFFLFLRRLGASEFYALGLALAYGLGTLAAPYSSLFYGHQLGASLGFSAFMLLATRKRAGRVSARAAAAAGLLAGAAVVVEYPMALVAAALAAYVLAVTRSLRVAAAYAAAAALPLLGLLAYNYACFDNPLALAYSFEKSDYFRRHHAQGFVGLQAPRLAHLYAATFSPRRGVFFLSPFLLFAAWGWMRMARHRRLRGEAWTALAIVAAFLVYVSTLWRESYAYGPGHRHMVPALPFLVLPLAFCPRRTRAWVLGLAAASAAAFTISNFVEPRAPLSAGVPFLRVFLPKFLAGELDYNWGVVLGFRGLASCLPFVAVQAGLLALLFFRPASPSLASESCGTDRRKSDRGDTCPPRG